MEKLKLKDYCETQTDWLVSRTYYQKVEAKTMVYWLLEHYLGVKSSDILANKVLNITATQQVYLDEAFQRLLQQEPIQYIIGEVSFLGLSISVNPNVLIPRPETEEWVQKLIRQEQHKSHLRILEIGTGSGCIAIALKKYIPQAEVVAVDVSEAALEVAQKNAKNNNVQVHYQRLDILENENWLQLVNKWDIIVSNPPYIPEKERNTIQRHVKDFEPALALFVPDTQPLLFYETILAFANERLNEEGAIYTEVHAQRASEVSQLANGHYSASIHKDMAGLPRCVVFTPFPIP
ncbi:MAG: peptide chain release factor N(5)-glutamine methyltransferase [Cytophagales bacterium]|nr:MAG: peptide chain release factor N(5)-glutamine methyltransferase [Cytophagales bacterium]